MNEDYYEGTNFSFKVLNNQKILEDVVRNTESKDCKVLTISEVTESGRLLQKEIGKKVLF